MYFGDHAPPHFHVAARDGRRTVVLIDAIQVSTGDADPRDIEEALEWARGHSDELMDHWNKLSGGATDER